MRQEALKDHAIEIDNINIGISYAHHRSSQINRRI